MAEQMQQQYDQQEEVGETYKTEKTIQHDNGQQTNGQQTNLATTDSN